MSDTLNLANSIWPNGMKVDSDGHAVFYPLGTNKVKVPTSSSAWPKGNKLVSPFVYQDDKLVGFVDTKALTVSKNTTIYLPYEHIDAEFSAINKGQLQIHAPNATTKKASWKKTGKEDIPEAQFKYKQCKTVDDVSFYTYMADISNGTWSEPLWNLTGGEYLFNHSSSLTSFNSDLPSLTNGYKMFESCENLTSFSSDLRSLTHGDCMFLYCHSLSEFESDLSSLTNGSNMFCGCWNITSFSTDLSSLTNSEGMFSNCSNLTSFNADLSSLTDGGNMFHYCHRLESFNSDLSSLTDGSGMFGSCSQLSSFSIDLPNLTDGSGMFSHCRILTSFSIDLPNLTDGELMFSNCSNIKSFSIDLSKLTKGRYMFYSSGLESFSSDLSSLTDGTHMFYRCKLDTASVQNIADTINTYKGTIHISISNSEPNTEETEAFNKIASKDWTVYVNGSSSSNKWNPTSLTPENGEETGTPIPFWAKPVQSDEETATYTDEQGNFYNILGAQFIYGDDISTYGMFTCEEDAAANMRLTPYIKPIEN